MKYNLFNEAYIINEGLVGQLLPLKKMYFMCAIKPFEIEIELIELSVNEIILQTRQFAGNIPVSGVCLC